MKSLKFVLIVWALTLVGTAQESSIYFGDLHTHTNLSADAVLLQTIHGEDRGPENACLFAKACAGLDFYGISDHAEMLNAPAWERSVEAIKQCNADSRDADGNATLVAFQGFEWTSSATGKYWGHKNVFFRNDAVPEMPVAAYTVSEIGAASFKALWHTLGIYRDLKIGIKPALSGAIRGGKSLSFKSCAHENIGTQAWKDNCLRVANEPKDLWAALNKYKNDPDMQEQGFDVLTIPHGTSWGMAKVATDWDIQLNREQHDPEIQKLVEVYSGHGNSEEWRDFDSEDSEYESCALRAGRLTWAHCKKNGGTVKECRAQARSAAATSKVDFATTPEDWGMCDQCPDCFQPAERYAPSGSVQRAMAMKNQADGTQFQFGFIAATDDHSGRPGSVQESRRFTDYGLSMMFPGTVESKFSTRGRNIVEAERAGSYFYPGGLVAVHATDRSREAIWDGLQRKEVYGTSGPRIQLWFYADQASESTPMGGTISAQNEATFRVRAIGAPVEQEGCSESTRERYGEETITNVCLNHCFNPSNKRSGIDRVEVVKITRQKTGNESFSELIQDPFLVLNNTALQADGSASAHFEANFNDPDYAPGTLYYVRAIQTPTAAVNGVPMTALDGTPKICEFSYKEPNGQLPKYNECMSMNEERAWSSPIFVE